MTDQSSSQTQRIAALLASNDTDSLRAELIALLERPGAVIALRALDQAGLLTQIIPELEPARTTDQPHVHFLPVLAHMLETVAAVEWLLGELRVGHENQEPRTENQRTGEPRTKNQEPENQRTGEPKTENPEKVSGSSKRKTQNAELPVAVQTHPDLRYHSVYAEKLRRHFAEPVGGYSRVALFKLAALLHDIAKPATKQAKPGGGVSFHEHQTIGGEMALAVAQRLGFDAAAARYIRLVVREHMRPGQLGVLEEVTYRAVARFFHATASAGPDVLLHLLADHMATRGPQINVASWLRQAAWIDALLVTIWGEQIVPTPPLLNGDQLMQALGITRGPLVGRLLAAVNQAQAEGAIGTAEEAIALANKLLAQRKA